MKEKRESRDQIKECLLELIEKDGEVKDRIISLLSAYTKKPACESEHGDGKGGWGDRQEEGIAQSNSLQNGEIEYRHQVEELRVREAQYRRQIEELRAGETEYRHQIEKLQGQEADYIKAIGKRDRKIEKLKEDLADLQSGFARQRSKADRLAEEKVRAEQTAEEYRDRYEGLDAMYRKYRELGPSIHEDLKNVLNNDEIPSPDAVDFLAFGLQEGNITALWDAISMHKEYDEQGKLEDLVSIFGYLIGIYQKISFKEVTVHIPKIGAAYDERVHMRTSDSQATGSIRQVILPGFSIGKNVNKKSLVRVG